MSEPLLSVCINTRNRADYLRDTLDSILDQSNSQVEVVVVDGASTDDTQARMLGYTAMNPAVRYYRCDTPVGIDEGYDLAVEKANGRYCWLMTDDDLVAEGAIDRLISEIRAEYDMILLELDCYSKDMAVSLSQPLYQVAHDRVFTAENFSDLWPVCGKGLSYIGSVVLRRSIWFEQDRTKYYGSYFVHVAVIIESTRIKRVLLISHPFIKYRSGNSSWTPRSFEIWNFKWPQLVWASRRLSERSKQQIVPAEPWRRKLSVLKSRAMGEYDLGGYKAWFAGQRHWGQRFQLLLIAILPRTLLNFSLLLFCLMFRKSTPYTIYNLVLSNAWPRLAAAISAAFGVRLGPTTFAGQ